MLNSLMYIKQCIVFSFPPLVVVLYSMNMFFFSLFFDPFCLPFIIISIIPVEQPRFICLFCEFVAFEGLKLAYTYLQ